MELAKAYTPSEIENKWYQQWENNGYLKPSNDINAPSYCIQLPPPNVTGTLHGACFSANHYGCINQISSNERL